MKAVGHHILAYLPNPKQKTKKGIILPEEITKHQLYGRVVSVGEQVDDGTVQPGDIIFWNRMGDTPVAYGEVNGEARLVAVIDDTVIGRETDDWLTARGLPAPPSLDVIEEKLWDKADLE